MPQRFYIHCTWGNSRQQGPPAKKAKLDEGAHCRADLVTECMERKKNTNIIRWLSFSFSAENKCPFSFSFRFRPQTEFHFRRHFRLRPKMINTFRSASIVYITKRSWSWDAKSWSWSWTGWSCSWKNFKVLFLVLKLRSLCLCSVLRLSSVFYPDP